MKFNYQFTHSKKQEILLIFSEFFFLIIYILTNIPSRIKFKKNVKRFIPNDLKVTILANGPSLENDIKNLPSSSQIFAVNTFPANDNFNKLKPAFMCWIDTMFIVNIENLSESLKVSVSKTYEQINKVNWNLVLFVPQSFKKKISSKIFNKNIKIITIPTIKYDFDCSIYLQLLSFLKLPPPRINVVVTAIYISLISGVKEVDLIGADMTQLIYSTSLTQSYEFHLNS